MKRRDGLGGLCVLMLATIAISVSAAPAPAPLPTPPLRFTTPVQRALANGLTVVVFPQSRLPLVQVQLMVPAGSSAEGSAPLGVASLTAQMLRQGTASRTASQFSADLERIGGTFSVSVTRDAAMVAGGFRASDLSAGLELISDAVLNPLFDAEAFESARRQAAQQLGALRRNGAAIADERAWTALFGAHPYARSQQGDIEALFSTKADQIRSFHRNRWRPDRAVLAVAGDVTPEQVFAAVEERFAAWAGRTTPDAMHPAPEPIAGVRVIDAPEVPTAELRWAAIAPGRADPALGAWQLLAASLNQHPALPRGARAQIVTLKEASMFLLSAPAAPGDVTRTAAQLRAAVDALSTSPPQAPALDALRHSLALGWPLPLESPGAQLTAWLNASIAGQPANQLALTAQRYRDPARFPDPSAAARALRDGVRLVVVGPADSLVAGLAAFGAVQVEPVDRPVVARPDTLPAPTAAELQRGRQWVDVAVLAHGGAARLRANKSLVTEGEMLATTGQNEISGQFSIVRVNPSRLVFSNKIFDFESRQVLDGQQGWMLAQADTASVSDADSSGVVSMQTILESDLLNILRNASVPGAKPAARGKDRVNGRECDLVDFVTARGVHVRLALDSSTRRVAAIDGVLGADLVWHERRVLTDMRSVGGFTLPYTEQRFVDGTLLTTFHVRKMIIDGPIDESVFRKPTVRRGRILGR